MKIDSNMISQRLDEMDRELASQSKSIHQNRMEHEEQRKKDREYHENQARKLQNQGKYKEAREHWRIAERNK
jgi:hypothetical protein